MHVSQAPAPQAAVPVVNAASAPAATSLDPTLVVTGRTSTSFDPNAKAEVIPQTDGKDAKTVRKLWTADRAARTAAAFDKAQADAGVLPEAGRAAPEVDAAAVAAEVAGEAETSAEVVDEDATGDAAVEPEGSKLDRAKAAADKAKRAASNYRRLQAEHDRQTRELEGQRYRMRQLEQQAQRGTSLEEALRSDPLAALKQAGLTPEQLVQASLKDGTPDAKIEALAAQLAAERKERETLQQTIRQREAQERDARAVAEFQRAGADATRYPALAHLPPDLLTMMGRQVAQEARARYIRETGTAPVITDRQILSYLNTKLTKAADPKAPVATSAKAPPATTATKPKAPPATPGAKAQPEAPRTLTNKAGNVSRPSNWDALPRNQRLAHLRDALRK